MTKVEITNEAIVNYLNAQDRKRGYPLTLIIEREIKLAIHSFMDKNKDVIINSISNKANETVVINAALLKSCDKLRDGMVTLMDRGVIGSKPSDPATLMVKEATKTIKMANAS